MTSSPLTPMQTAADPMRRAILQTIWSSESSVNELVAKFQVSQPAISFHLRQLRNGGYVQVRQQGTKRFYRAQPEAFGELRAYLESFWADKLALLKDAAELEARRRRNHTAKSPAAPEPAISSGGKLSSATSE